MNNTKAIGIEFLPIEIQLNFIKSIINKTCYEGFQSICSTNKHFRDICKTHLSILKPELNKCVLKKRLEDMNFDTKEINIQLINYIANTMSKQERTNLLDSISVLKKNHFPFVKGDTIVFLKNIAYMSINERIIFISFLISLLKNLNHFVPFILKISELPINHTKKEYLLNLSCNLIGIRKVFEKIILNPELDLSEPFLNFFVKNIKFSIDTYIRDLDLMISGLQEEINMIMDPEDRALMEDEYLPIIQKLERRLQFLSNIK